MNKLSVLDLLRTNKSIIVLAIVMYLSVLLMQLVLSINGIVDFSITNHIDFPNWSLWVIGSLSIFVNAYLVTHFVLLSDKWKTFKISFVLMILNLFSNAIPNFHTFSLLLIVGYFSIKENKLKYYLLAMTAMPIYQLIYIAVLFPSNHELVFGYNRVNYSITIAFTIIQALTLLLFIYLRRLEHEYKLHTDSDEGLSRRWNFLLYSRRKTNEPFDERPSGQVGDEIQQSETSFKRIYKIIDFWFFQILAIGLVLGFGFITGRFWHTFITMIVFIIIGQFAPDRVHWRLKKPNHTYWACTISSMIMFSFMTGLVFDLGLQYSFITAIYSALIIFFVLNIALPWQEGYLAHKHSFRFTKEQIKERCEYMQKDEKYLNFCIDAFVHELSLDELVEKEYYADTTTKVYRDKFRNELINAYKNTTE